MAADAYKRARGTTGVIVACSLLMVAGLVLMVAALGPGKPDPWDTIFFFIPAVVAFLIGWVICRGMHRRRAAGVEKKLTALGFQPCMEPTLEEKTAVWTPLLPVVGWLSLQGGASNIQWLASQQAGNGTAWIFEFQYITGSGKTTQIHGRTVVAWPAADSPLPGARLGKRPGFLMSRLNWLEKRAAKDTQLQDPSFADLAGNWTFFGDASTGIAFLTAEVRAELRRSPKGESWSIGRGWACVAFKSSLDGDNLGKFYERARRMLEQPRNISPSA